MGGSRAAQIDIALPGHCDVCFDPKRDNLTSPTGCPLNLTRAWLTYEYGKKQ
jgi:hypothetical protein